MSTMTDVIIEKREEIERSLNYIDVAAHLLSRGILTMQEHRGLMGTEEIHRVPKLIDIIKHRDKASASLIDAMQDPDFKGVYNQLVGTLKEAAYRNSSSAGETDMSNIVITTGPETEAI